jgi:hypothetical protein
MAPRRADSWCRWLSPPAVVLVAAAPGYAARYLTVEQAQAAMFPGERLTFAPLTLTAEQVKAVEKASGVGVRVKELRLWRAERGGVFIVDEVLGKHEFITWALGLGSDGRVRQIEILEYRETYGDEVRLPKWRAQFYGKSYGAALKLDEDIKNISGATLSCRHVTDGVRRLLATHALVLR